MPRKDRDIQSALQAKGFEIVEERKHRFFHYLDSEGRRTTIRTHLSHQPGSTDVSDGLLGKMARQVGLSPTDFKKLVDCPMSKEEYASKVQED
jgi:hypothetical protein